VHIVGFYYKKLKLDRREIRSPLKYNRSTPCISSRWLDPALQSRSQCHPSDLAMKCGLLEGQTTSCYKCEPQPVLLDSYYKLD